MDSVIKFHKKKKDFYTPYTFTRALIKGDIFTKLSLVIMGFGNIVRKQFAKGLVFLAVEAAFIYYMITTGSYYLSRIISLGDTEQKKVWNEAKGIFEYEAGDDSQLILLYAVVSIFVILLFLLIWRASIKSSYKAQCLKKEGKKPSTFIEDIKDLFDGNLHTLLLAPPIMGILIFTVMPLVYMISMAFTNYSRQDTHLILFDWVGFDNFVKILNFKSSIGSTFWGVVGWTIVWAIAATFLNFILGTLLALLINRKKTYCKSMWRFFFILSIAVPQFVSLLIIRTMFDDNGIINTILENHNIISDRIPFFSNATLARIMVITINLWVGIPYTLLQVTGMLQNIPQELYEAARVDGAGKFKTFTNITMPYMLFIMTPYLITTFTSNINNFNVIYLLSAGGPTTDVTSTAGKTDLLVTWLYKLTVDQQFYNYGAVIGILTFVVLATVSLITYRRSGSYKNEEGFQ